ncbi:tRNA (adenosine(37)-N6)-threonylcarbamoyltransferase complex dimerization subunit type 1 TsaB [Candidatus Peribacteria bacterium]|nr:tRNA (adenosine(37)-N6)-threonylcarbamoyltransferase complex dimerization subunit type 1 TsaB [Candidatus Peribacteria bacterium]
MMQAAREDIGALMRRDDDGEGRVTHSGILQRKIILHSAFFIHNSLVRTLYIDLASNKGFLALVTEQSVLASDHIDQRIGDHALLPRLETVLGVGGGGWKDITHIACVVGPGGFMSLRVGVALANTLSDQLGIPSTGIHLSDVYLARSSKEQGVGSSILWLHSTKKTELFVRGFGDAAKIWPEATHVTLEQLSAFSFQLSGMYWCGELIPEHRAAITSAAKVDELPLQSLEDILPAFLAHQKYQKQILKPWYGRGW